MNMMPDDRISPVDDKEYLRLRDLVIGATGLVFLRGGNNDQALRRVIGSRVSALHLNNVADYLHFVQTADGAEEMRVLIDLVTIGETYFFRDEGMFRSLSETVLPAIREANRNSRRLRIWSAGCSTGPEPYSISIMLSREFGTGFDDWAVDIVGTDINRKFLNIARSATYENWALRAVASEDRNKWFHRHGKHYVLDDRYRANVEFKPHNLINDAIPDASAGLCEFDLIVCRNVAIYFDNATIALLLHKFENALADGGWLVVGHVEATSEILRAHMRLEAVHTPGGILYRKRSKEMTQAVSVAEPAPVPKARQSNPAVLPKRTPSRSAPRIQVVSESGAVVPAAPSTPDLEAAAKAVDAGDWQAAYQEACAIVDADTVSAVGYRFMGIALTGLDRRKEAEAAYRRAVYLDRNDPLSRYLLAVLRRDSGDHAGADKQIRTVAKMLERRRLEEPVTAEDGGPLVGELLMLVQLWIGGGKPRRDKRAHR